MLDAQEAESLVKNLAAVRSVNYISVALFTVMLYDTILTIPREIRFIWEGSFSFRKVLYVICRYNGLTGMAVIVGMCLNQNPSLQSCRSFADWFTSCGLPIGEALVNILLVLRINALYGRDKRVFSFLMTLYIIELVFFFYTGIRTGLAVKLTPPPAGLPISGCLVFVMTQPNLSFTLLATIPSLTYSAVLLAFSVYKVREDLAHETPTLWKLSSWSTYHPLLLSIGRQGLIFYVVNSVIAILHISLVFRIHIILDTSAVPLGIVAYSICGCRFLLNFHELSNKDSPPNIEHHDTDGVVLFEDNAGQTYMLSTL